MQVLACVRPFLSDDGKQGNNRDTPSAYQFSDEHVFMEKHGNPSQQEMFSFDRVFVPSAGEDVVFMKNFGIS